MAVLLGNEPETGLNPGLDGMVWSGLTWLRWVDGAQRVAEMAQARAGELEQRVGEQAREQGELEALRRQVAQQQELSG